MTKGVTFRRGVRSEYWSFGSRRLADNGEGRVQCWWGHATHQKILWWFLNVQRLNAKKELCSQFMSILKCAVCLLQCELFQCPVLQMCSMVLSNMHLCTATGSSAINITCTLETAHCVYTMHCAMCNVQGARCNGQCAMGSGKGVESLGRAGWDLWRKKASGNEIIASTRLFQN